MCLAGSPPCYHRLIRRTREHNRQHGMKRTRRPQQEAVETSANSEIAKIKSCEQIVDEQRPCGVCSSITPARPTRKPQREQPEPAHACDRDAAARKTRAQQKMDDKVRIGDQGDPSCRLNRRRQQHQRSGCHLLLQAGSFLICSLSAASLGPAAHLFRFAAGRFALAA